MDIIANLHSYPLTSKAIAIVTALLPLEPGQ